MTEEEEEEEVKYFKMSTTKMPIREAAAWNADGFLGDFSHKIKWGIGLTGEALVALTYVLLKENPIAVGAVSSAIITLAAGLMNKVGQTRDNFHDSFWLKPWRTSGQDPNEQIETPIYHKN